MEGNSLTENEHRDKVTIVTSDIVHYMLNLKSGFSSLSFDEQIKIKNNGRPTPKMSNLININTGGKGSNTSSRTFSENWYQKYAWLTGSETKNKLFCWSCLLFSNRKEKNQNPWCQAGYDNLKELFRALQKHDTSKDHIYSQLKMNLFGKQNIYLLVNNGARLENVKHNELVKKNHSVLHRLIDIVIFLACQELAFRGHDESEQSLNQGNYRELIKIFNKYDREFCELSSDPKTFCGVSKTIQNELIESISCILYRTIEDEINKAICFSIEIDETTDISCQAQLSIVIRYALNGEVFERFLGFTDVSRSHKAEYIFNVVQEKLNQFDLPNKLIGQTYDGAAVMAGELNGLQAKIKTIAPQALFTHCHAHRMNLVLQDTCKSIKECRIFFANLSGFASFFSVSSKRTNVLNRITEKRMPKVSQTRWNFHSRLVNTVAELRSSLLKVFDEIIDGEEFENDNISIREATGLKNLLNDFDFNFLLNTFKKIFTQTNVIFDIIQNKTTDIVYSSNRIKKLLQNLKDFRIEDRHFQFILSDILDELEITEPPKKRQKLNEPEGDIYQRLYYEIIDTIVMQIETRFANFEQLIFFDIFNKNRFESFSKEFPKYLLESLLKLYPSFFNKQKLENELKVLYADPLIFGEWNKLLDMYYFIYNNSLHNTVPEIYKLLSLLLSLSPTSASNERDFSCLKRIKNYARNTMNQERMSSLSQMSIEKKLLKELQSNSKFYDDVIHHFATSKTRRTQLIYKDV
jgi:hypothetical protein